MTRWPARTVEDRFLSKVDKTQSCWLWRGSCQSSGYPQLSYDGRMNLAHRWAYEHYVGPIPPGLDVDHRCGVRRCVNPSHLQAVTRRENLRRAFARVLPSTAERSRLGLTTSVAPYATLFLT